MVHCTWYIVRGTLYVVHCTWYIARGTLYVVHLRGTHCSAGVYILGVPRTYDNGCTTYVFEINLPLSIWDISLNVPRTSWVSHVHLGCPTYIFKINEFFSMLENASMLVLMSHVHLGCPTYILGVPRTFSR